MHLELLLLTTHVGVEPLILIPQGVALGFQLLNAIVFAKEEFLHAAKLVLKGGVRPLLVDLRLLQLSDLILNLSMQNFQLAFRLVGVPKCFQK